MNAPGFLNRHYENLGSIMPRERELNGEALWSVFDEVLKSLKC